MIIPMLCVTIFVILVVWFLLPRVARLMIHTPTAISIFVDRKSGSAGMPRPISYAVFCLKKKKTHNVSGRGTEHSTNTRRLRLADRPRHSQDVVRMTASEQDSSMSVRV